MTSRPLILLVDDQTATRSLLPGDCDVHVLNPSDEGFSEDLSEHIGSANLVLIDQELGLNEKEWLKAVDGAALVGNFRSHARKTKISLPPVVLITNHREAYANEIPSVGPAVPLGGTFVNREHRLAPTLDVEWILAKDDADISQKILDLLHGSIEAKQAVDGGGASLEEIEKFLNFPSRDAALWVERGKEYLQRARPPVSESQSSENELQRGPTTVLRWLLQRVLPYPGLMLSDLYVAWTLRVTFESFQTFVRQPPKNDWVKGLFSAHYVGPLASLLGRRWWAAGVELATWQLHEKASQFGNLQTAIDEVIGGGNLVALSIEDPIVVWKDDLTEDQMGSIQAAVQLHPPGWPAEALDPWLSREEVASDAILQSMLDPEDLLGFSKKAAL